MSNYVREQFEQLDKAARYMLKVKGSEGETRWIPITPATMRRVADVLAEDEVATVPPLAPPDPRRVVRQTEEVRGELVTVTVDFDQDPIDVALIVTSLGVTWVLNEHAARNHGVASLWETQIGDHIWIVWTKKRATHSTPRPWQWFLARGIFDGSEPLEGECFVQEALVVATRTVLAGERT